MNTPIATAVLRIPLTNGKGSTIVDADYTPSSWQWYIHRGYRTEYARRTEGKGHIFLHREIMANMLGRPLELSEQVDHINGDGLDNRRANLRLATNTENQHNSRKPKTNTSGYKGVYWYKPTQKWCARIRVNGQRLHLGYFADPVAAARMYDRAALYFHGEFYRANFPRKNY